MPRTMMNDATIAGGLIGRRFLQDRASDRYVEVKRLAECEVTGDFALLPFVSTGNELAAAQAGLTRATREVVLPAIA